MANNVFPHFKVITETNCLAPRLENLVEQVPYSGFREAMGNLIAIRKSLRMLSAAGRISEISNWQQYCEALCWINGEAPLTTWYPVAQIDDYRQIDEATANSFNSYVASLKSTLNGQPTYTQTQLYVAAIESKLVDDIVHEQIEPLRTDFDSAMTEGRTNLISSLEELQSQKALDLNTSFNTQLQDIHVAKDGAIAEFTQARALADWSEFYEERVKEYELALYGKPWPTNAMRKKYKSYRKFRNGLPKSNTWQSDLAGVPVGESSVSAFVKGSVRCISKGMPIVRSKARSYSGKRTMWFSLLVASVLLVVLVNLASVYDIHSFLGIDPTKLRPTHEDTQLFAKIATYVALFAIPSLGYSFANKNYRIYSNILEQYRHRAIVAKTIQGVLKQEHDDSTKDIRQQLTAVAAIAMFEQKTIGHLTKNEANSTSVLDLITAFKQS
ncbi:MAG TPA: hypothetical protein VLF40_04705 [Candidatus Saccharimonadales bacterium]|nr:hypothetical protein [Candidatus Saccharimonadales bacterium]